MKPNYMHFVRSEAFMAAQVEATFKGCQPCWLIDFDNGNIDGPWNIINFQPADMSDSPRRHFYFCTFVDT
jgi:hypothetical protein